ncbi:hypothetical protein [Azotobacter salinestris]|uniref:hypothetical protein n=1 Tax=Azotobacter salinestris TaxID=69964 RepID=UPI0032DEDD43
MPRIASRPSGRGRTGERDGTSEEQPQKGRAVHQKHPYFQTAREYVFPAVVTVRLILFPCLKARIAFVDLSHAQSLFLFYSFPASSLPSYKASPAHFVKHWTKEEQPSACPAFK